MPHPFLDFRLTLCSCIALLVSACLQLDRIPTRTEGASDASQDQPEKLAVEVPALCSGAGCPPDFNLEAWCDANGCSRGNGDGKCSDSENPSRAPLDCEVKGDDLCTGGENLWNTPADCPSLMRVSHTRDGEQIEAGTQLMDVSGDGRRVVLRSTGKNIAGKDEADPADIFVLDLDENDLLRVTSGTGPSQAAVISADGRFVAFASEAADLIDYDTNNVRDVFVLEVETRDTQRVSVDAEGLQLVGPSAPWGLSISHSGRYVAYALQAETTYGLDAAHSYALRYDRDAQSTRVLAANWAESNEPRSTAAPRLSGNASVACFLGQPEQDSGEPLVYCAEEGKASSKATPDSDAWNHDFSRDEARLRAGPKDAFGWTLSGDGQWLAFSTRARLLREDRNNNDDVYLLHRPTQRPFRVSVNASGRECAGASHSPSLSQDGRIVAFISECELGGSVLLKDTLSGALFAADIGLEGEPGNVVSQRVRLSADARYVSFQSTADNLVSPDETEKSPDVFVAYVGDWLDQLPERPSCAGPTNIEIVDEGCEVSVGECSDGLSRRARCLPTDEGAECTCLVDGREAWTFPSPGPRYDPGALPVVPLPESCTTEDAVDHVLAQCHFDRLL